MNWYSKLDIFLAIALLFEHNSKLRYLEIYRAEPLTMKQLSEVLSVCENCQLEHICISKAEVPEKGVATFINSRNNLHSLLDLRFEQIYLGNTGSEALANLLTNPTSKIEKLVMDDNRLGNDKSEVGVIFLRNALAVNTTLRNLSFFFDGGDTSLEVWQGIVECVANPNAKLEDLSLNSKDIGDDGIICLADALADNQTLKVLVMIGFKNNLVSSEGWQGLSDFLINPITTLEQLLLRRCTMYKEGMIEIIMALEENSCLKELQITCDNGVHDGWTWDVLDQILCDTTSICCTFSSNHTLQDVTITTFEYEDTVVPDDTTALLDMNKNEDKLEVARQKILNHHFSGEGTDNLLLFACMPESVLVYAVAWVSRNNLGYSLMYDIIRGFPDLFDNRSSWPQRDEAGKKRKHSGIGFYRVTLDKAALPSGKS